MTTRDVLTEETSVPRPRSAFRIQPLSSIVLILAGWLCAALLVPQTGYFDAESLFTFGLVMSAGLLAGPLISIVGSPGALFRVEHLLMLGLFYWLLLEALLGTVHMGGATYEGVQRTLAAIAIFAISIYAGSVLTTFLAPRLPQPQRSRLPSTDFGSGFLFLAGVGCFFLGMTYILVPCEFSPSCLWNSFFAHRWLVPWRMENVFGAWYAVIFNFRYFGFLVPSLAVALYFVEGRFSWRVATLTFLSLVVVSLLFRDGGRRAVGTILGAAILLWVLLHTRVRLAHLLAVGAAAVLVLVILQAMFAWRYVGVAQGLIQGVPIFEEGAAEVSVDRNLFLMGATTTNMPDPVQYTGWRGLSYYLFLPVPRVLWPGKPTRRGVEMPEIIGMPVRPGWSWTCSGVCDIYIMWGLPAVAMGGVFFGFLANLASRLLYRPPAVSDRVLYAAAAMTLFMGLRNIKELILTGLSVVALLCILLAWRTLVRRRAANTGGVFEGEV